jgi:hypothetical protein
MVAKDECIILDMKTPRRQLRHGSGLTLFTYRYLSVAVMRISDALSRRVTLYSLLTCAGA